MAVIYIKIEQSSCVREPKLRIKEIASIYVAAAKQTIAVHTRFSPIKKRSREEILQAALAQPSHGSSLGAR